MIHFLLLLIASLFSISAFSQTPPSVQMEVVQIGGSGCPEGGATAILSPDLSTVSVLFDQLGTDVPPSSAPLRARVECTVTLAFKFEGKYRVGITGSDVRGFVAIPQAGRSRINIQHVSNNTRRAGEMGRMSLNRSFIGPVQEDLFLQSDLRGQPIWSWCGTEGGQGKQVLTMDIHMVVDSMNRNPTENLTAFIDSLDIGGESRLNYHLIWTEDQRSCPNGRVQPGPRPQPRPIPQPRPRNSRFR